FWFHLCCRSDFQCGRTDVGNEEGIGGNHIFHQAPFRYLDRNTDTPFSKHNFEIKENSSCQSPLTLSAPSFNCSEQCSLFSSPPFQNSDKGNIWPLSCTKESSCWQCLPAAAPAPAGPGSLATSSHRPQCHVSHQVQFQFFLN
uniref:Uncharacterized protein n=1 Tax=Serinus canaria TaxID=9135 RepID=A0A8C9KS13_SERCA